MSWTKFWSVHILYTVSYIQYCVFKHDSIIFLCFGGVLADPSAFRNQTRLIWMHVTYSVSQTLNFVHKRVERKIFIARYLFRKNFLSLGRFCQKFLSLFWRSEFLCIDDRILGAGNDRCGNNYSFSLCHKICFKFSCFGTRASSNFRWIKLNCFHFTVIPSILIIILIIILVPGDGGSQLWAKLDKPGVVHWLCDKTTKDFFPLWLNLELFVRPFILDCWVDNMRWFPKYNNSIHWLNCRIKFRSPPTKIKTQTFRNKKAMNFFLILKFKVEIDRLNKNWSFDFTLKV